jgi:anti-sigma factor RsiW
MRFLNSHLSDHDLLRASDGDLSPRQLRRVEAHLAECWTCRARRQEIENAIGEFVRAHQESLELPPVDGPRALLRARLRETAAQIAEASPHPAGWRFPEWRPVAYIAAACACAALALLGIGLNRGLRGPTTVAAVSTPRASLTPGAAVFASREQICAGDPGKNRPVPAALRRQVLEEYGIPASAARAYEVDYLITPALGGADDIRNLWPQSYSSTVWNARVKDALEDRLHELVCMGNLDLATAQRDISADWIAAYKKYFGTDEPGPGQGSGPNDGSNPEQQ